jgi:UTP--glucose-1-phosphate uridylyltransferase
MSLKIRKAVLPVAGAGSRFLPISKAVPKELLPLVDTPVLQLLIDEAIEAGVEEVILVVSPAKQMIRDYLTPDPALAALLSERGKTEALARLHSITERVRLTFVTQAEPLGDGHAILQAEAAVGDEPFLVLFGDDLVFGACAAAQLVAAYQQTGSSIVGLLRVPPAELHRYGVVALGEPTPPHGLTPIQTFVEKPTAEAAPSDLAIVGKYLVTPALFTALRSVTSVGGEIRMLDGLARLSESQPVFGLPLVGRRHDTGCKSGYVKAMLDYALTHPETAAEVREYLVELAEQGFSVK